MAEIQDDTIYVSQYDPDRVLVIKDGKGNWEPGRLYKSEWRDSYYVSNTNSKGAEINNLDEAEPATQEEVLAGLQEAICSLNERLKGGL